jgi:Icc-related predicted phosphoesterase
VKIVAFSDTHSHHRDVTVPDGDVLVFAGDFMTCGRRYAEVVSFADWFMKQPHKHKVLVVGNHDRLFESQFPMCLGEFRNRGNVSYLHDSGTTIDGVKFWGSPVQPWFCDWAFNVHRGAPIKKHWDKIPTDTDVLITHGPPWGILDQSVPDGQTSSWGSQLIIHPSEHLGCEELAIAVNRVKPVVNIFGHIHGSYGKVLKDGTWYHNVAICDEQYNPVNEPHVIEL